MKQPKNKILNTKYSLTIGWLYPDLMCIYGDRGNVTVLQKRCEWRSIETTVKQIGLGSTEKDLLSCDLLMMGGAQDSQQTIVATDLEKKKVALSTMIEEGIPGLYVCGGFQFLGKYYKEADGTIIEQLGILDVYTENPGGKRLIGNIAIEVTGLQIKTTFVGFENHGGRTSLGSDVRPLGKVIKGYGSNARDKTEGAVYRNTIGTYFHGPILPKNPELADWLITKALEKKYKQTIELSPLDDSLSKKAREVVLTRLGVSR
ncbi:MAG TPA: type 1 glutamine amidotransferase [Patescibacteria group bacterium]|nr:type 1 glutamine amidotransferase [Patescibacteria group bacterium]